MVHHLTRIEVDLLELVCTNAQLVRLNTDALAGSNGDDASVADILRQLGELGSARLLTRINNTTDLDSPLSMTIGKNVPIVQDMTVGPAGKAAPSISYNQTGVKIEASGNWRSMRDRWWADIQWRIELSNAARSTVEMDGGVTLPSFQKWEIRQKLLMGDGRPVVLFGNDLPMPGDDQEQTTVMLARLVAHRLPGPEPEAAATGEQTLLHMEVYELTGDQDKLADLEPAAAVPPGANDEEVANALGRFGKVELISRPTMILDEQEGMLHIGEQVPFVQHIAVGADGSPQPQIKYKDIGLKLYVRSRWLTDADRPRATIDFRLEHTSLGHSSVEVGGRNVALPILTQRTCNTVIEAEAGKPAWIAGRGTRPADKDRQANRLLIRVAAERI